MNLNQGLVNTSGVDFINFLRPIRALRPTFEKLFIGVRRALRRALSFDRAISMICALRPTFMKSTPGQQFLEVGPLGRIQKAE